MRRVPSLPWRRTERRARSWLGWIRAPGSAFEALGAPRRHRRGATVLFEGDTGDTVLFVVEGRLKVLTTTTDGRELVLGLRGPGELLGELTAIAQDGRARYATVVALDDLHVRVDQR